MTSWAFFHGFTDHLQTFFGEISIEVIAHFLKSGCCVIVVIHLKRLLFYKTFLSVYMRGFLCCPRLFCCIRESLRFPFCAFHCVLCNFQFHSQEISLFWNVPSLLPCPNRPDFALMIPLSMKPLMWRTDPTLPSHPFKAYTDLRIGGRIEHLLKTFSLPPHLNFYIPFRIR